MKMFQIEAQIAADRTLVLHELPFAPGERVAVTVTPTNAFAEMRSYAERLAESSDQFIGETDSHVTERLLRETQW
jgi:hypothetical protein